MTKGEEKAKARADVFHVEMVRLDHIDQGDQLIREDQEDESIIELSADIARNGLLQPIGVTPTEKGRYQLLYGARRSIACRRLRWETIPAHVHQNDGGSVRGIAARENLLRRDLSLAEEIHVVRQLHEDEGRSPEEISSLTGKGRAWVLRRLAIPNLPADLRDATLEGALSIGHSETLARIEDEGLRAYATQQVRSARLNLTDTRGLVQAILNTPTLSEAIEAGEAAAAAQTAPQRTLVECFACNTPRPIEQLMVVRICHHGCPKQDEEGATTDGNTTH